MRRNRDFAWVLAGVLAVSASAYSQMVVHAVSGKVKAINAATQTMDVTGSDGATNPFKIATSNKVNLDFGNDLRSDSIEAQKFQRVGDFAVVYYYGYDNDRTAVAVKDLGAGPLLKVDGTVAGFNKKDRVMTVKDASGKSYAFTLGDHLIVDTGLGVDNGRKYDPHKGALVRVTYAHSDNQNSALFLRLMIASY